MKNNRANNNHHQHMQYKDIFIDFDDTLYATRENSSIALRETFDLFHWERHFPNPEVFISGFWTANVELWAQYTRGEITREYLMEQRFMRPLGMAEGLNADSGYCRKVSDRFLELCSCKPGVVDGAHELMSHLRVKGYRTHICSNGFHEVQYRKLAAADMAKYFDTIVLSEDAGAPKPSLVFFDHALKATGARRETTIMIGDNYDTDIIGAMDSGLATILFNRWDKDFRPPKMPDHTVSSLRQIIEIL